MLFQSTRPSRDGTVLNLHRADRDVISIHPPLAGRDRPGPSCPHRTGNFNPPAPRGTGHRHGRGAAEEHAISIHPPLAGRDGSREGVRADWKISIHPPLAGRDLTAAHITDRMGAISTPPPLAGRDVLRRVARPDEQDFNPPAPRGTGRRRPSARRTGTENFNPPAPRGMGLCLHRFVCKVCGISIHPPLAGRDAIASSVENPSSLFQSTRPSRDGTSWKPGSMVCPLNFNPPAPRGTGPELEALTGVRYDISIHPPLAGRDGIDVMTFSMDGISIHPPLAGRDCLPLFHVGWPLLFQSTRPSRDGTRRIQALRSALTFQSTRPSRDGTNVAAEEYRTV